MTWPSQRPPWSRRSRQGRWAARYRRPQTREIFHQESEKQLHILRVFTLHSKRSFKKQTLSPSTLGNKRAGETRSAYSRSSFARSDAVAATRPEPSSSPRTPAQAVRHAGRRTATSHTPPSLPTTQQFPPKSQIHYARYAYQLCSNQERIPKAETSNNARSSSSQSHDWPTCAKTDVIFMVKKLVTIEKHYPTSTVHRACKQARVLVEDTLRTKKLQAQRRLDLLCRRQDANVRRPEGLLSERPLANEKHGNS